MAVQAITVEMPTQLYDRLKRRAEQAHRSVEAEVIETVAEAVPTDEELAPDLMAALAQLTTSDDPALWQTVQARFPEEKAAALEALHLRRQATGLSQTEAQQAAALAQESEKFMFLRAQAMALLMQRGYDLSTLALS